MNILIIGSGGREHAIASLFKKSSQCDHLFFIPGNAGTAQLGTNIFLDLQPYNFYDVGAICITNNIELVFVGPEQPLVDGLIDYFKENELYKHIPIIGPNQYAAQLEGSKAFAKEFMLKNGVKTANYGEFSIENSKEAFNFIDNQTPPIVLKADGLAAGKGVLILDDKELAKAEIKKMWDGKFGDAGSIVIIESFLKGIEFSAFLAIDGKDYILLPEAKDYKRIGEGDTGLNTGGMGAVSPVPFFDSKLKEALEKQIIIPTMNGLVDDKKMNYKGILFLGLMWNGTDVNLIEYNCRLGDPETEVILPRIKSDFIDMCMRMWDGNLKDFKIEIDKKAAATIMLVSGGYPEKYEKGKVISNLEKVQNAQIFLAGAKSSNGQIVTNGGRVLAITSIHQDLEKARDNSLKYAELIDFEGKFYRKDIGNDVLN